MFMNFPLLILLAFLWFPIIFAYGDSESEIDLLLNKGMEHFRLGEYNEAISYYDKILEKEPNNIDALFNKGHAYSKLGKYWNAIKTFDKVLEVEPNNIEALFNQGDAYSKLGEYRKAISYYDKILEKDPNNIDALYNNGIMLTNLGNYKKSILYFERVINIDPHKFIAVIKLQDAVLRGVNYKVEFLDGVLEIKVHDRQGDLVAYVRTTEIKALKHEITENFVEKWPIIKTIVQNNQNYNVHQQEYFELVEANTIFGFHEMPYSEKVDFPMAVTWHFQIPVEQGDQISYVYSIFRPVR